MMSMNVAMSQLLWRAMRQKSGDFAGVLKTLTVEDVVMLSSMMLSNLLFAVVLADVMMR
jgi:hypothetical protein